MPVMGETLTYRVIAEKDLSYTVEIREPGMSSRVTGFRSQEDAEAWLASNRDQAAGLNLPPPRRNGASRGQADCVGSATALPLGRHRAQGHLIG
jgi:hypothetical protein